MDPLRAFFDDVGDYPPITAAEEITCAKIIHGVQPGDVNKAIERLIFGNIRWLRTYVPLYYNPSRSEADIWSEAMEGATIAAWRFKPVEITGDRTKPTGRWISYARFWIRARILEKAYDKRGVAIPAPMRKHLHAYRAFCGAYFDQQNREPSLDEIRAHLGLDVDTFRQVMDFLDEPVSINEPLGQHDDLVLETAIAPPENEIDTRIQAMSRDELVQQVLATLPSKRMKRIVQLRFGLLRHPETDEPVAMPLLKIGPEFLLVRQQITTIEQRAMSYLRDGLMELLQEEPAS